MDSDSLWRLVDVPYDRLDALPFGAVVVDASGTIVAYNDYEQRLAQRDRDRVMGLNFFRDVAPCTAVKAFEGRFHEFFDSKKKERVSESFGYFFPFAHAAVDVQITFVRLDQDKRVLIAIERVDKLPPN